MGKNCESVAALRLGADDPQADPPDALLIETFAKARLADAYDTAQAAGEVAGRGGANLAGHKVGNLPTVKEIVLRYDELHEAQQFRDFERAEPGATEAALEAEIKAGKLLKELARAETPNPVGANQHEVASQPVTEPPSPFAAALDRTGISRMQAHGFQALAKVDRAIVDKVVAEPGKLSLVRRIRAHATRRAGELLNEIEAGQPGPKPELREGTLPKLTRTEAAEEAGMSEHQQKQAMRIAAIPEEEFEAMVGARAALKRRAGL